MHTLPGRHSPAIAPGKAIGDSISTETLALKRAFDVVMSVLGLLFLSLPLVLIAIVVKVTSAGPVLFKQERMGRRFRPFMIYKFRSMVPDAPARGSSITSGEDPRVTRIGRILRKSKLDELPQLLNVLRGDMSLVGPRPEVRRYVEMFRDDYEEILRVRPGITDLASIEYRDEQTLLGQAADPEAEYVQRVLPEKIRLAKQYVRSVSLWGDISIIFRTFWRVLL